MGGTVKFSNDRPKKLTDSMLPFLIYECNKDKPEVQNEKESMACTDYPLICRAFNIYRPLDPHRTNGVPMDHRLYARRYRLRKSISPSEKEINGKIVSTC